jgi:hypothetical protein
MGALAVHGAEPLACHGGCAPIAADGTVAADLRGGGATAEQDPCRPPTRPLTGSEPRGTVGPLEGESGYE